MKRALIIAALLLSGCAGVQSPRSLELSDGRAIPPPACAAYLALGVDCPDLKAGPCSGWALRNHAALIREGRKPHYATWGVPGGWHINVVFQANDGTWYARDGGVPGSDTPVADLVTLGWTPWAWQDGGAWAKLVVANR